MLENVHTPVGASTSKTFDGPCLAKCTKCTGASDDVFAEGACATCALRHILCINGEFIGIGGGGGGVCRCANEKNPVCFRKETFNNPFEAKCAGGSDDTITKGACSD